MNHLRGDRDAFEQWLQESVDSLKMYPAAKIWFSLFNHLHPSKKFPSAPIAFFMFCWILCLQPSSRFSPQDKETKTASTKIASSKLAVMSTTITDNKNENHNTSDALIAKANKSSTNAIVISQQGTTSMKNPHSNPTEFESSSLLETQPNNNKNSWKIQIKESHGLNVTQTRAKMDVSSIAPLPMPQRYENNLKTNETVSRFSYQLYAGKMMSMSYLLHESEAEEDPSNLNDPSSFVSNSKSSTLQIGQNWEAGGGIVYRFSSLMQFKAGFQLNYKSQGKNETAGGLDRDMIVPADDVNLMNLGTSASFSNRQFQLSLPIGADLKLAGDRYIQWYAGATVQPSINMQNSSNWIGDWDERGNEKAIIKNWNLQGGLETFLSIKLTKGIMFNLGPQLRYQLYSNLKDRDLPNERIYNVGLKFGISSSF